MCQFCVAFELYGCTFDFLSASCIRYKEIRDSNVPF